MDGIFVGCAGSSRTARAAVEAAGAGSCEGPALVFDSLERLWVATTRDRDNFSYLDIWIGTEYAGTVRIRDRLMGYDILGSTLAALVERKPGPDGVALRAVDWYDIGDVEFGN